MACISKRNQEAWLGFLWELYLLQFALFHLLPCIWIFECSRRCSHPWSHEFEDFFVVPRVGEAGRILSAFSCAGKVRARKELQDNKKTCCINEYSRGCGKRLRRFSSSMATRSQSQASRWVTSSSGSLPKPKLFAFCGKEVSVTSLDSREVPKLH